MPIVGISPVTSRADAAPGSCRSAPRARPVVVGFVAVGRPSDSSSPIGSSSTVDEVDARSRLRRGEARSRQRRAGLEPARSSPPRASTSSAKRDHRRPYCLPFSIRLMTVWSMPDSASSTRCVHCSDRRLRRIAAPSRSPAALPPRVGERLAPRHDGTVAIGAYPHVSARSGCPRSTGRYTDRSSVGSSDRPPPRYANDWHQEVRSAWRRRNRASTRAGPPAGAAPAATAPPNANTHVPW